MCCVVVIVVYVYLLYVFGGVGVFIIIIGGGISYAFVGAYELVVIVCGLYFLYFIFVILGGDIFFLFGIKFIGIIIGIVNLC